jgi:hypothetical protein
MNNATGTPAVWVLHYWHRHGDDLSAHANARSRRRRDSGHRALLVGR